MVTMLETACLGIALALGLVQAAPKSPASAAEPAADKLPLSGLPRAKLVADLCLLKYRVSTASPECQQFFDQGLGYYYSYVWMEAARSFETATQYDPDCALAWWGLSRALERWSKDNHMQALQKAHDLQAHASHREQLLIQARAQEKGLGSSSTGSAEEERKQAAIRTLDELL